MSTHRLEFTGSQGDPLAARLELPATQPRAYAVFAHCLPDEVAAHIARVLTGSAIAVLRLDLTPLGDAPAEQSAENVAMAAVQLGERYAEPALLIGHSLGGAAVLAAAHRVPGLRAVATIGAAADPERDAGLKAALLVLHSPVDEVVSVDHARRIFDAARHPKSFVSLDGADHRLSDPDDARFAATVLVTWSDRYLDRLPPGPVDGHIVVSENEVTPYGQQITAGRHILAADEPEPTGHDTGPGPYDLLLAALGSCTSMTIRMYARRKQLPLDHVSVRLRHARMHAEDCAQCETKAGLVDHIERSIRLDGDLDPDQRRRLLEIADRCPVHRTLTSAVSIHTYPETAD